MNEFLSLPDWAPGWLGPVLMILGALFALAFLLMPFTVFSLKSRLEQIELKLEDLQADLRAIAGGEPHALSRPSTSYAPPSSAYAWPEPAEPADRFPARPPIAPPPVQKPYAPPPRPAEHYQAPPITQPLAASRPEQRVEPRMEPRPTRAEPKLNWPR